MYTLIVAVLLCAQPLLPPLPEEVETYKQARERAIGTSKPLVVFVGCEQRKADFAVVVSVDSFQGDSTPRIVVAVSDGKKDVVFHAIDGSFSIPPDGDIALWIAAQLRVQAAFERQEAGRVAAPFGSSARLLRRGEVRTADDEPVTAGLRLAFLAGMERYKPARNTQAIYRLGSFSRSAFRIDPVSRDQLEDKWKVPGHMVGVDGWKSDLYKSAFVSTYEDYLPVVNSSGDIQHEQGWTRKFKDGSIFADVLSHNGRVFEVRVAEKVDGDWQRYVAFKDVDARPIGYVPPRSNECRSCHSEAGSGKYGVGLVPGGDTIISLPFDALER